MNRFCQQLLLVLILISLIGNNLIQGLTCRCNSPECLIDSGGETDAYSRSRFGECTVNEENGFCLRRINVQLTNTGGRVRIIRKRQQYRCDNTTTTNLYKSPDSHEFRVRLPLQLRNSLIIEYRCRNGDRCASSVLFDFEQCGQRNSVEEEGLEDGDEEDVILSSTYLLPRISPPERNLSTTICTCLSERSYFDSTTETNETNQLNTNTPRSILALQEEKRSECRWTNYAQKPYQQCKSNQLKTGLRSPLAQAGLRANLVCRDLTPKQIDCTDKKLVPKLDSNNSSVEQEKVRMRCEWRCRYRHNCNNANEFTNVYCSALEELRKTFHLAVGAKENKKTVFTVKAFGSRGADKIRLTCGGRSVCVKDLCLLVITYAFVFYRNI